jgi:hypothetical protein
MDFNLTLVTPIRTPRHFEDTLLNTTAYDQLPQAKAASSDISIGDKMADKSGTSCTICGAPSMSKCAGCKTRRICGKECQTKDWPIHKSTCKDLHLERALHLATKLTLELCPTFREHMWQMPNSHVEDRDTLIMYRAAKSGINQFKRFPYELVGKSRRARVSMPIAWRCDELYALFHNLMPKLLRGRLPAPAA